uniref:DNA-directed RNA polymerase subunit beta n=1 Tax=Gossypium raimondii TaxID=29730 RepID=A0A0D2SBT2_GOSRA|nr:hypothetical protein B456_007G005200 [Gossypium raimondii]
MRLKQEDIFLNNNTNNLYVSEIPVDKQKLAAPIKSVVDKFQILPEFLKVRGLVKQHFDSFNYFVNTGIKKVVSANDRIVSHIDPAIYLRFNDVRIGNPSMTTYEKINPHTCRLADMTYAAPIFADIEYMQESHGQRTRLEKKNVVMGRMPIMLRSCRCVLYGKDEAELARLGECPLDPGGYFIINGAEKVIPIREQLAKNRIIIDADNKGNITASVTSISETIKSRTVIKMDKEKIYLLLNQFVKKIPIMVVMKAMGIESDQEVMQMVGADPCYSALLLPSIEECARIDIYTQEQALAYLNTKVQYSSELGAFLILRDIFLANVPVRCNNLRPKCLYVAVMLRRMMEATLNKHAMDDKDYMGNKHLELSGQLISLLFECYCLGVEDMELLSGEELHTPNSFLVMLNGLILGKHRRPQHFANALRKLRRAGKIGEFVSVFVNEKQRCVYISSDGGRVCRPLVIVDKGISRIKEHHMKELLDGVRTFNDFLGDGLVEYLDVNEENNALIALYEGEVTPETTHIEIEPFTILGCAMGKQAMGNIAYNQLCRMDTLLNILVYPQRPLVTTRTIELVGYDKLGAGQNATVAVMSCSGYDIEDAIVMNKASLDRGFGRCNVMKKYSNIIQKSRTGASDSILRPQRTGPGSERMQILDDDGIAAPGEIIRPNDILLNKVSIHTRGIPISSEPLMDSACRPAKQLYKGPEGESCVLDRVALSSDQNGNLSIKFLIRHTRRPELGDKFSSRHGQKGVCGIIIQQEDLPFSERGICPDLIMNPHGFPSRMTVGKMIELLGGKAGVSCGRFHYGSAFGEPSGHADKVETISETLIKHGFCYNGKDFIYSGITGFPLQAYIFMGPIYYQKLKHMVLDKMRARGNGPRVMLTRQPTEGRTRKGGLRVGEMERDCLIAYGASMLIYERMMLSSDPYDVQVCRKCGLIGYYSHKLKIGFCSSCKIGENVSSMKLPYACKLLIQELQSMNIVPRLKLVEP